MAKRYRQTQARFRKKVKFMGVDGGAVPLISATFLSLALIVASGSTDTRGVCLCASPFVATLGIMLALFTDKRPHFASDALTSLLPGARFRTARRPRTYPIHPGLNPASRGNHARSSHP